MPSLSLAALLGCGVLSHCLVRLIFAVLLPVASDGFAFGDRLIAASASVSVAASGSAAADAASVAASISASVSSSVSASVSSAVSASGPASVPRSCGYPSTVMLAVSRSCWGFMGCGSLIILICILYTVCASDAASVCAPAVGAAPSSSDRAILLVGCGCLIILTCIFYTVCASDAASVCAPAVGGVGCRG